MVLLQDGPGRGDFLALLTRVTPVQSLNSFLLDSDQNSINEWCDISCDKKPLIVKWKFNTWHTQNTSNPTRSSPSYNPVQLLDYIDSEILTVLLITLSVVNYSVFSEGKTKTRDFLCVLKLTSSWERCLFSEGVLLGKLEMLPAPQQDFLFLSVVCDSDDLLQDDSLQRHRVLLFVFINDEVQCVSHFHLQVETHVKERSPPPPDLLTRAGLFGLRLPFYWLSGKYVL